MIKFAPIEEGPLTVFFEPVPGEEYCVGIDTSTGVASDYTVMQVLTRSMPFEQVAVFRAKWSVVEAARFANLLGLYYNQALIVCETNYPGNAVQDALVMTYQYPNNFRLEEHLDEDPNVSSKYGFQTTQASKWLLIREFQKALLDKEVVLNHKHTIEELGTYVYIEDRTKTGAAPGLNDDCVMAIMLAFHGAMMFPEARRKTKKEQNVTDSAAQSKAMMDRMMKFIQEEKGIVV